MPVSGLASRGLPPILELESQARTTRTAGDLPPDRIVPKLSRFFLLATALLRVCWVGNGTLGQEVTTRDEWRAKGGV
jgi:hypothetical protein